MRTFIYTLLGLLVTAGLFLWGWVEWSKERVRKFQLSKSKVADIQESQRGRRPMWQTESRKERNK